MRLAASTLVRLAVGHLAALGEADGAVPDGTTVFDDEIPGVANLDPDLLGALRQAATDAANDGVEFVVDSGWRSPEYQDQLLREAVSEYGSEAEAARWVATAETSPHVSGDAVDIGPSDATAWLSEHGAEYGLCQIYSNEPWHSNCAPKPSITVARPCTPTLRTIQGCSGDQHAQQGTGFNAIIGVGCSTGGGRGVTGPRLSAGRYESWGCFCLAACGSRVARRARLR